MRVSVEFRHASWHDEAVFDLLERHGAAYCVMSGARLPCVLRATAPFVYVRMHGPAADHLYAGSHGAADRRGGADGGGNGAAKAATCSSTSTTTATATQ